MNTKKIERRYDILRTLIAIGIALVLALMVIVFISENPLDAMKSFSLRGRYHPSEDLQTSLN